MRIHRLIFRFDFGKVLTGAVDESGKIIAEYIEPACDENNGELAADFGRRFISATFKDDLKATATFNVEVKSIIAELESANGIEFRALQSNKHFSLVTKLCDQVIAHCKASSIHRFGLRVFVMVRRTQARVDPTDYRAVISDGLRLRCRLGSATIA